MPELNGKPWQLSNRELLDKFDVDPENGLGDTEAVARLKTYGHNRLQVKETVDALTILVSQFKNLIVLMLAAAAIISALFGEWVQAAAIIAVVFINAAIGFFTELRAVRSMEALRHLGMVSSRVRRNGKTIELPAIMIVPGDIAVLESGEIITADTRLLESSKLETNESSLTGESMPVGKNSEPLSGEPILAEMRNMLFKGTTITRGSALGLVVSTGMQTELGKISSLVEQAEEEITPLEKKLDSLGKKLIWVTLIVALFTIGAGIRGGKDILLMIETGIALAVSAIPEGLPIVATIALARGMWRMARRNALVNRLSAVETLGATSVILVDKTGTLTENRMTVTILRTIDTSVEVTGESLDADGKFKLDNKELSISDNDSLLEMLKVGVLCSNASLDTSAENESGPTGDPLEIALLAAGAKAGLTRNALVDEMPEEKEVAFDPELRLMATYHRVDNGYLVAVKGAPGTVVDACRRIRTAEGVKELTEDDHDRLLDINNSMASEGLRIIGVCEKTVQSQDAKPYEDLVFLGFFGMIDPPRAEVKGAIEAARNAGVRFVMVTGDQEDTAINIATKLNLTGRGDDLNVMNGSELGDPDNLSADERSSILNTDIFVRVSPAQKLHLLRTHQEAGAVVAMSGDGVNDAPALKKADIGVAMGKRGTQVAREAADMVLKDDNLCSVVAAIELGRAIFNNIRKFVLYLLSCNLSEIMIIGLAAAVNSPLPLLPLQILFLNLVTDVFPALALSVSAGEHTLMEKGPRPISEGILKREHWYILVVYSLIITAAVLGAFAIALKSLDFDVNQAVTVAFLTLALAQLWHVFNMRDHNSGIFINEITRNPFVWGAIVICMIILLLAWWIAPVAKVLQLTDPGPDGWILILGMSLIPLILGQGMKLIEARIPGLTGHRVDY